MNELYEAQTWFKDSPALARARNVYLAGPFFTPEQVSVMENLEHTLNQLGASFFSPRLECRYDSKVDPPNLARKAYFLNKYHIERCGVVVAVLAWPDMGTSWELGYAAAKGIPRLGLFTNPKTAMNVMVRQTVDGLIPITSFASTFSGVLTDHFRSHTWATAVIRNAKETNWSGEQE